MANPYDVIVIGAGHNGLVAGAYLAKVGRRVLILEAKEHLGGAAATEMLWPGFKVNSGSPDAGLFLPEIVKDLGLAQNGLRFLESPAYLHALDPAGSGLTLWRDTARTVAELSAHSPQDAARYRQYCDLVAKLSGVLAGMMRLTPPALPEIKVSELAAWVPTGLKARRLGDKNMMEFLRVLPMPAWELLEEWFETALLQGALGIGSVAGSMQGPWAAGTALMMLYLALGAEKGVLRAQRAVAGGTGALSDALAAAATAFGAEVRIASPVQSIQIESDRARGVILASGENLQAETIISTLDAGTTLFKFVGPDQLETDQIRSVRHIKYRGSTARMHLALNELPDINGVSDQSRLSGRIVLAPSLEAIEMAYDDAKYGRPSENPCLEIHIPTLLDPSLAPADKHLMTIDVRYAPYALQQQDWPATAPILAERVLAQLSSCMPNLTKVILHQELITPVDYETRYGLPEGSIFYGQMGLDQLLIMRPTGELSRYQTSIDPLYLAGSAGHPGAGVTGAPGYNAARVILKGGSQ